MCCLRVSVETKHLKHLQNLMVVGTLDDKCHVGFHVLVGGKWQFVVSAC